MKKINIVCYKSLLAFISLTYLPGLFFYNFFAEGFHGYYNYNDGLYLNFFILLTVFLFLTFLVFVFFDKLPYLKHRHINSTFAIYIVIFLTFVFFLLSLHFAINYTSSFRHKNRLVNSGAVSLLFLLKPMMYFIVALMLVHILNGDILGKKSRLVLKVILISSIISLNSSLQFVIVPIILSMLYSPRFLTSSLKEFGFKNLFIAFFLIVFLGGVVVFIGVGNKVGYEYLLTPEGFSFFLNYGNILFPRMSTSLFSSVINLNHFYDGLFYSDKVLEGVGNTVSNRFSVFFPTEIFDASLIESVNRLNYLNVFRNHAERAGASPGIISSIFYTPFFPFSIFFIPLYVGLIYRAFSYQMKESISFNFLSLIILPYLILSLFESPLNILLVLDPVFVLFLIVTFFSRFIRVRLVFAN